VDGGQITGPKRIPKRRVRSTKIGNIPSLWCYDAAACYALQSMGMRQPAISHYAGRGLSCRSRQEVRSSFDSGHADQSGGRFVRPGDFNGLPSDHFQGWLHGHLSGSEPHSDVGARRGALSLIVRLPSTVALSYSPWTWEGRGRGTATETDFWKAIWSRPRFHH
jgi:hypothetical protein